MAVCGERDLALPLFLHLVLGVELLLWATLASAIDHVHCVTDPKDEHSKW